MRKHNNSIDGSLFSRLKIAVTWWYTPFTSRNVLRKGCYKHQQHFPGPNPRFSGLQARARCCCIRCGRIPSAFLREVLCFVGTTRYHPPTMIYNCILIYNTSNKDNNKDILIRTTMIFCTRYAQPFYTSNKDNNDFLH